MSTSCSRRSPSSPPRWPTPCWGISWTAGSCSTSSACPIRSCARWTRCSWWPAAPPITPGCWPSTPSSIGRGCRWRWSWPASSATATRCWTAAPWWWRSRSPGRPPTRWRRCATPRRRRPRCWPSATPTVRRFRASATRCSTPGPDPRSAWPPPRRFWPRSPPTIWSGWRWRRPAAPNTATRSSASTANWRRCPSWWRRCWPRVEPVAQLARSFAPSSTVLFLGRHVGYPVALEGALKLKELAYMHAEGFAAGELKHGPIALIEDGLPVIVVMPSPKNSTTLHSKLLSNIREIQARGAITIVIAEEGDETVRALRRSPVRDTRGVNTFAAAAVHDSAAGVRRRRRAGPRLRRRQTAQPGQVRHRRVALSTSPSRKSTSRRGGAAGNSVASSARVLSTTSWLPTATAWHSCRRSTLEMT